MISQRAKHFRIVIENFEFVHSFAMPHGCVWLIRDMSQTHEEQFAKVTCISKESDGSFSEGWLILHVYMTLMYYEIIVITWSLIQERNRCMFAFSLIHSSTQVSLDSKHKPLYMTSQPILKWPKWITHVRKIHKWQSKIQDTWPQTVIKGIKVCIWKPTSNRAKD